MFVEESLVRYIVFSQIVSFSLSDVVYPQGRWLPDILVIINIT